MNQGKDNAPPEDRQQDVHQDGPRQRQRGRQDQHAPHEPSTEPDPEAGFDREVGDLEDPDAEEDDGALPGRAGGGLAGG